MNTNLLNEPAFYFEDMAGLDIEVPESIIFLNYGKLYREMLPEEKDQVQKTIQNTLTTSKNWSATK